jgi:hypothetical protein
MQSLQRVADALSLVQHGGFPERESDGREAPDGITGLERTRRGCNQRRHLNTATLVTPLVRFPVPNYLSLNNERSAANGIALQSRDAGIRPN